MAGMTGGGRYYELDVGVVWRLIAVVGSGGRPELKIDNRSLLSQR